MKKLVILDRDGVINHDSDDYIKSPAEWRPIDGSLEAIARLCHAGFRVVVATNQSGIARGLFTMDDLADIHNKMLRLAEQAGGQIEAIFFCPHAPRDRCECRKPKPGMYLDIARRFNTPLNDAPIVGDSLRDLQAAAAAGARPLLVRTGKGEKTLATLKESGQHTTRAFADLGKAAEEIINAT